MVVSWLNLLPAIYTKTFVFLYLQEMKPTIFVFIRLREVPHLYIFFFQLCTCTLIIFIWVCIIEVGYIILFQLYINETKKKLNFCRQRSKMPRSPRSFLWAMEFKSRNVYFFIVLLCTGHQRKKKELHYLIHFSVQLIISSIIYTYLYLYIRTL